MRMASLLTRNSNTRPGVVGTARVERDIDALLRRIEPGDIVVIPPHTVHGFAEISTQRIVYTLIRIDPQQILELRSKAE